MRGMRRDAPFSGEDVDEVIRFARPRRTDIVACIGRGGAALAAAFAGRGDCAAAYFEKSRPHGRDRIADLLVVGATAPGDEIGTLLCSNMHILKPGGQLILRLQDVDDDCIVQSCLSALGYGLTSTVFDLSVGVLVMHRIDIGRHGSDLDRLDADMDKVMDHPLRKPALSFGKLYSSSSVVGSVPGPAPFIQSSWS